MPNVHGQAISSVEVEQSLSRATPGTFASLCNALALAAAGRCLGAVPSFTERVNVGDGGIDGELILTLPDDGTYLSPLLGPGANILQFKQRDFFSRDRDKIVSTLVSNVKDAVAEVVARTKITLGRYVLFTNIDLVSNQKGKLKVSLLRGHRLAASISVEIVGAAELAALLNQFPHLRSAYFASDRFSTWQLEMRRHTEVTTFGAAVKLIGRDDELKVLRTVVDDPAVRVVVLSGPHQIGKSRLALEAIAHRTNEVIVALDPAALTLPDLQALEKPGVDLLVLAGEPEPRRTEELIAFACGSRAAKLILTVPTPAGAPDPHFGLDPRVRVAPVGPLRDTAARALLQATGAKLDFGLESWIVDQAGGNPGILLTAARVGREMRQSGGALFAQVADALVARVRRDLGEPAIRVLEVLSVLTHVAVRAASLEELELLCGSIGAGLAPNEVLRALPELERAGLVHLAGSYAEVVPPLLANRLAGMRLTGRSTEFYELLSGLSTSGRYRFLRRLGGLRGEEIERFWGALFRSGGPLENFAVALESATLIRSIAGSAPEAVATLIEGGLKRMTVRQRRKIGEDQRRELRWALDELLFRWPSSLSALRSLALLADAETESYRNNTTGLFTETFLWSHPQIPLPLDDRLSVLRENLSPSASVHRKILAVQAIREAVRPMPSVTLRRGIGANPLDSPPDMAWAEVFDYLDGLLGLLMSAARSKEPLVSESARQVLPEAVQEVCLRGRRESGIARLTEIVSWGIDEKFALPIAKLVGTLQFIGHSLQDEEAKTHDLGRRDALQAHIRQVHSLLGRFGTADFETRLKRWAGAWAWGDQMEVGGRRDRYDEELERLAEEAIHDPASVTPEALAWLVSGDAQKAYLFFGHLGRLDLERVWLTRIEELGTREGASSFAFSAYFGGMAIAHAAWVRLRLDELVEAGQVTGRAITAATASLPATLAEIARVERLIGEGRVDPEFAEKTLSGGGWIRPLSSDDFLRLLRAIAGPKLKYASLAIDFLGMWRHLNKPLAGCLADFAWQCLERAPLITPNDEYDFDTLATYLVDLDPDRGFRLLERLLSLRRKESWRPIQRYQQGMFWRRLCSIDRARALGFVLRLATRDPVSRFETTWDLQGSIDQQADSDILLRLVEEGQEHASLVSEIVNAANPGFWPIAIEIAKRYPNNSGILDRLANGVRRESFVIVGPPSAHYQACREEVQAVLTKPGIPPAVRRWLEQVSAGLQEQAEQHLVSEANDEVEALCRIVENRAAPTRLWAIGAMLRAGQYERVQRLVRADELRRLIPKLKLSRVEMSKVRTAMAKRSAKASPDNIRRRLDVKKLRGSRKRPSSKGKKSR